MDAHYDDQVAASEACTEILQEWPKLLPHDQEAMLADLNLESITFLGLMTLARHELEATVVAIRRRLGSRPANRNISCSNHHIKHKETHTDYPGPISYGSMGWTPDCG
ncbi:hypothetical protein H7J86_16160 [Mycobacterium hackensackense]|uniref:hypothetical protein n=1 Tax=Mycobacterium hackensackense TaxID=228909 RepID=UPI002265D5AB|nr:hypothetical protein [Mycobacterium hackensackense]MCV7253696.1 hypothetical protein [Mycobacterium hackensackense]